MLLATSATVAAAPGKVQSGPVTAFVVAALVVAASEAAAGTTRPVAVSALSKHAAAALRRIDLVVIGILPSH
jgi:hypothetical protein